MRRRASSIAALLAFLAGLALVLGGALAQGGLAAFSGQATVTGNNFTTAASFAPVHEETQTGGSSSSSVVSTATNVTAVNDHLYLAAISTKPNVSVTSVTGLGLAWTLVKAQCAARSQTRIEVWKAQGTPTGGETVSANLASAPLNAVIAVSRYSDVSTMSAIGSVTSSNTLGPDGACSGGTDTASYSLNLTTTAANAAAYGAAAIRLRTHTPGAGYTEQAEVHQGASGDTAGVAVEDKPVASPSTIVVDGTLNSATDWAVVAVEIRP